MTCSVREGAHVCVGYIQVMYKNNNPNYMQNTDKHIHT